MVVLSTLVTLTSALAEDPARSRDLSETPSPVLLEETLGTPSELGLESFRAILIGVQDYQDPKIEDLRSPLRDVEVLGNTLKGQFGFETEILRNPGRTEILAALDQLRDLDDGDAVLVYLAGHGEKDEKGDEGYFIPSDAKEGNRGSYVSAYEIVTRLRASDARHIMLVSDYCFPAVGALRARGLKRAGPTDDLLRVLPLIGKSSRWVITSGGDEPVSDDGPGGMSVFAAAFNRALTSAPDRYVPLDDLYPDIRNFVRNQVRGQTPQHGPIRELNQQFGQFVVVNRAYCGKTADDMLKGKLQQAAKELQKFDEARGRSSKVALDVAKQWLSRWGQPVSATDECGRTSTGTAAAAGVMRDWVASQEAGNKAEDSALVQLRGSVAAFAVGPDGTTSPIPGWFEPGTYRIQADFGDGRRRDSGKFVVTEELTGMMIRCDDVFETCVAR